MPSSASPMAVFCRNHLFLIPGALALFALFAQHSGLDHALTTALYDPVSATFPARTSMLLELFGHHFAKTAVTFLWVALLVVACSTFWLQHFRDRAQALWAAVLGMALGPMVVVAMKGLNSHQCPWNLREFGGAAELSSDWFVAAVDAGYCFPGGHAASGFSLIALFFLLRETQSASWTTRMLWLAITVGTTFSLIRMAQGAHFLSHNLWAAAICWWIAALFFVPLQRRAQVLRHCEVAA